MPNQIVTPRRKTKGARLASKSPSPKKPEDNGVIPEERRRTPPARKKNSRNKVVRMIVLVVCLAVVGSLTYALTFYDKIYPNVSVGGVNLGGKTKEEADSILEHALEEILNERYEGAMLTLSVAGEDTVFTLEQAGLRLVTGDYPSRQAWEYGHTESFFARLCIVVFSPFSKKDFPLGEEQLYIDRSVVDEAVAQAVQKTDVPLVETEIEKLDESIRVTIGTDGCMADREGLAEIVVGRLTRGDFSPIIYEPSVVKPQPVDLNALYEMYCTPAQNARLDPDNLTSAIVLPEKDGLVFDQDAAQMALDAAAPGEVVILPLVAVQAEINAATLKSKMFSDQLASFTTYLNAGNKPRTNNIRLSASFINDMVLLPGGEFSFNGTVGQRTTARGFQSAGAYLNGRLIDEVGGGICQIATTVYNAAVRANLEITERRCHSLTVGYVPLGHDATVNWGTTDLKFKNNTDYPIKIQASQSGGSVTVTIIGTKVNDYTVSFEHRTLSTTPFETKTVNNPALAPGARKVTTEGHNGATAESYRVIKDKNGKEISRKLEAKSTYSRVDQVVEVGPAATPTPETPTTPETPPPTTPAPPSFEPDPTPTMDPDPEPDWPLVDPPFEENEVWE